MAKKDQAAVLRASMPPLPPAETEEERAEKEAANLEEMHGKAVEDREQRRTEAAEQQEMAREESATIQAEMSEDDTVRSGAEDPEANEEEAVKRLEEAHAQPSAAIGTVQSPSPAAQGQIVGERLHNAEGAEVAAAPNRNERRPGDARPSAVISRKSSGTITREYPSPGTE